jgi:hypothetical protein
LAMAIFLSGSKLWREVSLRALGLANRNSLVRP